MAAGLGPPEAGQLVEIPAGPFRMGSDDPSRYEADGEGPVREINLSSFTIGATTVTNLDFAAFVDHTGYRTDAERFGWSFVFHLLLPDDFEETRGVAAAPWWRQVEGARWSQPEGRQSNLHGRWDHPVVHVSWNDAVAYCRWAGVRLPTEAEWEKAARGGLVGKNFPWGDEFAPGGQQMCNIFDGDFPTTSTQGCDFVGTVAADSFEPNGYGLHNVAGNVWEWCQDWFDAVFHDRSVGADPIGPPSGQARVMRGGSYLCHDSYCHRYRVSGRSSNTPESSSGNLGFRVAGA